VGWGEAMACSSTAFAEYLLAVRPSVLLAVQNLVRWDPDPAPADREVILH